MNSCLKIVYNMAEAYQAIQTVARRTGLSAHVIRIWEKRYGAVVPERTATNRRLYSDDQIERLILLRTITQAGHSIGDVANLPAEKLRQLAKEAQVAQVDVSRFRTGSTAVPADSTLVDECVAAVKSLDARALDETLKRTETELGAQGLLQRVVAPLVLVLGDLWRAGGITSAQEHFASAVLRVYLGQAAKPFAGTDAAPVLVVTTPAGQLHELGALLVGAAAANLGWLITYLGASLPAAEIAGAARQNRARAVALSLVYPEDDPRLEAELTRLRELLPQEVTLLVGGRAAPAYSDGLNKIGAIQLKNLTELGAALDELRKLT